MSTKTKTRTKSTSRTELRRRIIDLEAFVEQAKAERQCAVDEARRFKDQWLEETQKASQALAARMENDRLAQREKLVALIASNKNLEAIDFLLTAQVMLFKVDVRFADDNARNKAEDEMLQRLVKIATDALAQARIVRSGDGQDA